MRKQMKFWQELGKLDNGTSTAASNKEASSTDTKETCETIPLGVSASQGEPSSCDATNGRFPTVLSNADSLISHEPNDLGPQMFRSSLETEPSFKWNKRTNIKNPAEDEDMDLCRHARIWPARTLVCCLTTTRDIVTGNDISHSS
jgi:hypothetical protein